MVDSVNTNASAFQGISSLNKTRSSLATDQREISTGLKVSSAKDDAATFAIAQTLRSSLKGQNAVQQSLDRAISTVDVSLAASGTVSNLLLSLKEKAVTASDPGLDDDSRRALNEEFSVIRDQITSTLKAAGFNGNNPLVAGGGDITAITNETGDDIIRVTEQNLSLGGNNVVLTESQDILTASNAQATVAAIETSISNVTDVLSTLGSTSNRLEGIKSLSQTLSDTTESGLGNLVDADLASSSASLSANRIKEQLGIASLNIANQSPQNILQLFRN